jgi:putative ABC transport system ATP-binding protein
MSPDHPPPRPDAPRASEPPPDAQQPRPAAPAPSPGGPQGAEPASAHELRAEGVGVDAGRRALLDGIDLVATAGRSIALTGPSGAGKTLLLRALAGHLPLQRGRVRLNDAPLGASPDWPSRFGLILQNHGLASGLTAEENIALPLQARGLEKDDIAVRCTEALQAVDLGGAGRRLVDELSGGQRQRVGVARALAGRPDVLLADEPTTELDPANRTLVLALLLDPSAQRIVVIAANDPEIIDSCDQVIRLRDGRIDVTG